MAKILYALSGLGYGHATRGKPILEELEKEHSVRILTDNCSYRYLSKHFKNIEEMRTETMTFSNNKVDIWKTGVVNAKNLPRQLKDLVKVVKLIRKFKPDLIINDFTLVLSWLGWLFRIPVISIDNESIVTAAKLEVPTGKFWSYLRTYLIVKGIVPRAIKQLIPTFFSADTKDEKKTVLCKPLLRKEIKRLTSRQGKHILVYRYGDVGDNLVKLLSKIPQKFIIYGLKNGKYENITYKGFGDSDYLNDLAECKAIVSYGGFSLTSEALYLGKPILAIPIQGQFEQELNSSYIEKLGFGKYLVEGTEKGVKEFLKKLSFYRKNIEKHKNNYSDLLPILKKEINLLIS